MAKNYLAMAKFLKLKKLKGIILKEILARSFVDQIGFKSLDVLLSINSASFDRHGNVKGERISRKRNFYDVVYNIIPGYEFRAFARLNSTL